MTLGDLADLLEHHAPLIAVSFGDRTSAAEIAGVRNDGLDVAELRIDRYESFEDQHVLEHLARFSALPTIATIRVAAEGGEWNGTEAERLHLFETVLPRVHGVDIELASTEILADVVRAARAARKVVIVSGHNFERTPDVAQLEGMAEQAKRLGADYFKFASVARSLDEFRTLARFTLANVKRGLIVVAMGEYGPASRVLFPVLGSRLTYASLAEPADVDGQLSFAETFEYLRRFYPSFNDRKIKERQLLDDA